MAENNPEAEVAVEPQSQGARKEKDAVGQEAVPGVVCGVRRHVEDEARKTVESEVNGKMEPGAKDKAGGDMEAEDKADNAAMRDAGGKAETKSVAMDEAVMEPEAKPDAGTAASEKATKELENKAEVGNKAEIHSTADGRSDVKEKGKMAPPHPISRTCHKCGKVLSTRQALMAHLNKVWPCDAEKTKPQMDLMRIQKTEEEKIKARTCIKCGKTFPSKSGLRSHMVKLISCDPTERDLPRSRLHAEDKTCPKCGHTFTTPHGLRMHMNRITPCDQDPLTKSETQGKEHSKTFTCHKCGKVLKSRQSLQIHLHRVNPCDAPKVLPRDLPLSKEEKEKVRKERARQASRKAYRRRSDLLRELKERIGWESSESETFATPFATSFGTPSEAASAANGVRKRGIGDDDTDSSNSENKRSRPNVAIAPRSEPLAMPPPLPSPPAMNYVPPPPSPAKKSGPPPLSTMRSGPPASATKSGYDQPGAVGVAPSPYNPQLTSPSASGMHGGDLATDGCCCSVCVRGWARNMMARMQSLEQEVARLREERRAPALSTQTQIRSAGTESMPTASSDHRGHAAPSYPSALVSSNGSRTDGVSNLSTIKPGHKPFVLRGSWKENPRPVARSEEPVRTLAQSNDSNVTARGEAHPFLEPSSQAGIEDARVKKLTGTYNHLNGQILLNEGAVEDSLVRVEEVMSTDRAAGEEFLRQINELRVSIDLEKKKRSEAIAAVLFAEWGAREDFASMLQTAAATEVEDDDLLHKRCAALASELEEKDMVLGQLTRRIEVLARSASPDQYGSGRRSRHEELGELSSKVAAELATKTSLEIERRGVYLDLLKSSAEVRTLLRKWQVPKAAAA